MHVKGRQTYSLRSSTLSTVVGCTVAHWLLPEICQCLACSGKCNHTSIPPQTRRLARSMPLPLISADISAQVPDWRFYRSLALAKKSADYLIDKPVEGPSEGHRSRYQSVDASRVSTSSETGIPFPQRLMRLHSAKHVWTSFALEKQSAIQ